MLTAAHRCLPAAAACTRCCVAAVARYVPLCRCLCCHELTLGAIAARPPARTHTHAQGLVDLKKPPEKVSRNMTGGRLAACRLRTAVISLPDACDAMRCHPMTAMCVYSMLFMRFAWMVQPRNYLLFACHASNESVQFYHFQRRVRYEYASYAPRPLSPLVR